jgi:hypothetical protein
MSTAFDSFVGKVGAAESFPIIREFSEMFSEKGIRTVFFSVGASASSLPDLEIAEAIGCPINVFPLSDSQAEEWKQVAECLKTRTEGDSPFLKGVDKIWVLPKNIRVRETLPWWATGTIQVGGATRATKEVAALVGEVCADLKVKGAAQRIDILKIDTGLNLEGKLICSVLHEGFRPAIILINWSETPDSNVGNTLAAGHLQNCGYKLVGKIGNKFAYYYVDDDLYMCCSWEKIGLSNPIVTEITRAFKEDILKSGEAPVTDSQQTLSTE